MDNQFLNTYIIIRIDHLNLGRITSTSSKYVQCSKSFNLSFYFGGSLCLGRGFPLAFTFPFALENKLIVIITLLCYLQIYQKYVHRTQMSPLFHFYLYLSISYTLGANKGAQCNRNTSYFISEDLVVSHIYILY